MADIDQDFEELSRTDAQVNCELEDNSKENTRRDMADIFMEAEEDMRIQEARYS